MINLEASFSVEWGSHPVTTILIAVFAIFLTGAFFMARRRIPRI